VALVRTDVSDERISSIIKVKGIIEHGTTLAVTRNRSTMQKKFLHRVLQLLVTADLVPRSLILFPQLEAIRSSETLVLTSLIRRLIPENGILFIYYLMANRKGGWEWFSQYLLESISGATLCLVVTVTLSLVILFQQCVT
jgi:hypothetical protein